MKESGAQFTGNKAVEKRRQLKYNRKMNNVRENETDEKKTARQKTYGERKMKIRRSDGEELRLSVAIAFGEVKEKNYIY